MVGERGVVEQGVGFEEGDCGGAELVEGGAVAGGFAACEAGAEVQAVGEDGGFLGGG